MQADKERQQKMKREQARKLLTAKLRKQAEERRRMQETKIMNSIEEVAEMDELHQDSLKGTRDGSTELLELHMKPLELGKRINEKKACKSQNFFPK